MISFCVDIDCMYLKFNKWIFPPKKQALPKAIYRHSGIDTLVFSLGWYQFGGKPKPSGQHKNLFIDNILTRYPGNVYFNSIGNKMKEFFSLSFQTFYTCALFLFNSVFSCEWVNKPETLAKLIKSLFLENSYITKIPFVDIV